MSSSDCNINSLIIPHMSVLASCEAGGNTYRIVPGTGCTQFTQETAALPPMTLNCPATTAFDVSICVCNMPSAFNCPI